MRATTASQRHELKMQAILYGAHEMVKLVLRGAPVSSQTYSNAKKLEEFMKRTLDPDGGSAHERMAARVTKSLGKPLCTITQGKELT